MVFSDPSGLLLHKPLLKLKKLIFEDNVRERNLQDSKRAQQHVALVLGFSSTITDKDLELSRDILEIIKSENPGESHCTIISRSIHISNLIVVDKNNNTLSRCCTT